MSCERYEKIEDPLQEEALYRGHTVGQRIRDVLEVLHAARRDEFAARSPVSARRAAIARIAKARGVRPETVRASCVRALRPTIATLKEFDALLGTWMSGEDDRIVRITLDRINDLAERENARIALASVRAARDG